MIRRLQLLAQKSQSLVWFTLLAALIVWAYAFQAWNLLRYLASFVRFVIENLTVAVS